MADVITLVSSEQSKLATQYLDDGDLEKCKATLQSNFEILSKHALLCPVESERLNGLADDNRLRLLEVDKAKNKYSEDAIRARKNLRSYQRENDLQQRIKR